MPPKKGYKPTAKHRRHLSEAKKLWHARIRALLEKNPILPSKTFKQPITKAEHPSTPVPPSASSISKPLYERWGLYGFRENGDYYFLHERFDSLIELQEWMKKVEPPLPRPLWTFTASGHTEKECFIPIRIPPSMLQSLGHRFQQLKEKKK